MRLYELSGREANGLSNFNQTIILITAANRLTRSKYIIHESYRELLRTGMLSDLNVQVQEKQRDKDDILQTFMLPVHSAVVGIRAQSLASSIGWARHSPATKECKPHDDSNNLFLDPDICGDIDIARCFLDYLYSGLCPATFISFFSFLAFFACARCAEFKSS